MAMVTVGVLTGCCYRLAGIVVKAFFAQRSCDDTSCLRLSSVPAWYMFHSKDLSTFSQHLVSICSSAVDVHRHHAVLSALKGTCIQG